MPTTFLATWRILQTPTWRRMIGFLVRCSVQSPHHLKIQCPDSLADLFLRLPCSLSEPELTWNTFQRRSGLTPSRMLLRVSEPPPALQAWRIAPVRWPSCRTGHRRPFTAQHDSRGQAQASRRKEEAPVYIGLDFGTSGARAIAIDGALTPLYHATHRDCHAVPSRTWGERSDVLVLRV